MIPDAAVEAGLYAWGFSSQTIDERRELLKRILEAAAPHMLAVVWDEGAEAGSDNQCAWDGWRYSKGYPLANPYRTAL